MKLKEWHIGRKLQSSIFLITLFQPPITLRHVETHDAPHAITYINDGMLDSSQKAKFLKDIHVHTITKNLVSIAPMVELGPHDKSNQNDCFVENPKDGYILVAKGTKEGMLM
ncbi:hypothetical protein KP509_16G064300 [Ceratopteris richardii]|uniref:Uncharacterized protein n=1 Tax=Ceratopteris richardii TaxID=49495 RepID=A0A8T2T075_CERRI|nr:hypothetical protein KP509_16G064300 [Ceratopteris richardii]